MDNLILTIIGSSLTGATLIVALWGIIISSIDKIKNIKEHSAKTSTSKGLEDIPYNLSSAVQVCFVFYLLSTILGVLYFIFPDSTIDIKQIIIILFCTATIIFGIIGTLLIKEISITIKEYLTKGGENENTK